MNKIFNEQYELLLKDMEEITDPYHRAHIRALVLQAVNSLTDISEDDVEVAITGKDAIKEDIAKDTKKTTTETTKKKTTTASKKTEKDVKNHEPNELDLEKDPNINNTEPLIVNVEGTDYDIREAYNLLDKFEGTDEERIDLATNITAYGLTAIYETLSQLKDSENKMTLAYYLNEYGLDEINNFTSELTDGTFNDIYEFINDDNLEGFITNIEAATEEE